MYERNAIVLERYLSNIFGKDNETNVKSSFEIYKDILEEMEKYQVVTKEEEKVIKEFDEIAKNMQTIQKKQEVLCSENMEHEEERNKLFNDLDQAPEMIEKKILRLEQDIDENIAEQKEIRENYIELLNKFVEKQKERNKCAKTKRATETNHIKILNDTIQKIENIDLTCVKKVKEFINIDNDTIIQSLTKIMLENGKNEKVKFDNDVIKKAVEIRVDIAKKEAECYTNIYEKLRKLMSEIESDNLKLDKYKKLLKNVMIKLDFIEAEKEYIISFLDNERMTAINGEKLHKQMMKEATVNFEKDIKQIKNLYDLILREIAGKASKKAYRELYNSTYLLDIEETEKSFNQEASSIKSNVGTMINTNYWRIEGIKNLYEVFNKEIEENFERDLTEFMPEEEQEDDDYEEEAQEQPHETNQAIFEEEYLKEEQEDEEEEWFISNDEIEDKKQEEDIDYDVEDEYEDDDDYEEDYDEEYDDDDYEEEYNDEDEYDDDYDDEDEYEDEEEYDDNYEYEDDEYDSEKDADYEYYDEDIEEEQYEDEIIENKKEIENEKIRKKNTNLTKNSRKQTRKSENDSKGIFGKIFKK